jgi:hypothetical protein
MDVIRAACAEVDRALGNEKLPRAIYVRRDAWPRLEAQLEKKAVLTGSPLTSGIPINVVDWPLPVPWCTDVDLEAVASLAAFRGLAKEVSRG